jgi:hypothetical protein
MKEHRHIYDFIVKVYMEKEEEITKEIAQYSKPVIEDNFRQFFKRIDKSKFMEGVDIPLLFQSLQWCADGFMREALNNNKSIDEIDNEFTKILELYKNNFYKEDSLCITMNTETEKTIL